MLRSRSNIDHLNIMGNKERIAHVLRTLGFVFGNNKQDPLLHVVFEHGYLEASDGGGDLPENLRLPGFVYTTKGELASIFLGSTDVRAALTRFQEAGIPCGDFLCMTDRRRAKHGENKGMCGFTGWLNKEKAPWDDVTHGAMGFLNPKLMYEQKLYMQINGVRAMEAIMMVGENEMRVQEAYDYYTLADQLLADTVANDTNLRDNYYMTREEYREFFGVEYTGTRGLDLAAIVFEGGDMVYLKEQCEELGLSCFNRGLDLYVNVCDDMGTFFIFHCDPLYDVVEFE